MRNRVYQCYKILQLILITNAPKDKWNLALNSIRIVQENGEWYVAIGGEIAPYAVYTNERWNRGINPNENWIEKSIEEAMPMIRRIMSDAISTAEINEWTLKNYINRLTRQYREHIDYKRQLLFNI